jgi:hypothetical protein
MGPIARASHRNTMLAGSAGIIGVLLGVPATGAAMLDASLWQAPTATLIGLAMLIVGVAALYRRGEVRGLIVAGLATWAVGSSVLFLITVLVLGQLVSGDELTWQVVGAVGLFAEASALAIAVFLILKARARRVRRSDSAQQVAGLP